MPKILFSTISNLHIITPIAISLATGILWQAQYIETTFALLFVIITTSIASAAKKPLHIRIARATIVVFAFLLGALLYNIQQKQHQQFQKEFCAKPITIRGHISDIAKSGSQFMRHLITINLDAFKSINTPSDWIKTNKTVQIYTRTVKNITVSDTIELADVTFKITKATGFKNYLIKKGIYATAFLQNINFKLLSRPSWSIKRWVFTTRENLLQNIKVKLSPKVFGLFSSIFLGNRTEVKEELEKSKSYFKAWGILHFLARSGLHLVIFILLWELFLRFIPIAFTYKQILLFFIAFFYCAFSWSSVSFARAFLIFLLYKISFFLNTRAVLLHLLILVFLIMLIINPILILFLDFQLSFGLTCALAWFGRLGLQKARLGKKH